MAPRENTNQTPNETAPGYERYIAIAAFTIVGISLIAVFVILAGPLFDPTYSLPIWALTLQIPLWGFPLGLALVITTIVVNSRRSRSARK